jgi:hypothetical protein
MERAVMPARVWIPAALLAGVLVGVGVDRWRDATGWGLRSSPSAGTAGVSGSGVGQPEGVVTSVEVRLVGRDQAGRVGYVDTVNLEHALRAYHRARAIWTLQDQAVRALKLERDDFNRPLWLPVTVRSPVIDRAVSNVAAALVVTVTGICTAVMPFRRASAPCPTVRLRTSPRLTGVAAPSAVAPLSTVNRGSVSVLGWWTPIVPAPPRW